MIDVHKIEKFLAETGLDKLIPEFQNAAEKIKRSSDYDFFEEVLNDLPNVKAANFDFSRDEVQIGSEAEINGSKKNKIKEQLKKLMPWRKGPFNVFGIEIDAEWRSNLKWNRIKNEIGDLQDRKILDIGCGNGYYIFRMLDRKPAFVLGVEPYLKNFAQFQALKKFLHKINAEVLPFGIDELPNEMRFFDTVFSMGVFYHRRSPFDHLQKLKNLARSGGEIILETLVIDGKDGEVLVPKDRYAKMRNVWFIPSAPTLASWLERVKFKNIRLVNVSRTTFDEQRKTEWMDFESLEDFLDKRNPNLTIEGYPVPQRAVFIFESP